MRGVSFANTQYTTFIILYDFYLYSFLKDPKFLQVAICKLDTFGRKLAIKIQMDSVVWKQTKKKEYKTLLTLQREYLMCDISNIMSTRLV